MTKIAFKPTHLRVYDENGVIYAASPNMDAYELVHTLVELQKDSKGLDDNREPVDNDRYGDIDITLNEVGKAGFITSFPDGADYDDVLRDIKVIIKKYWDAAKPEYTDIEDRLRGHMAVYPQGEDFDEMVAEFREDKVAAIVRLQRTFDRLHETIDSDYIYANIRVGVDLPDQSECVDYGSIIDFVEMKIGTYALGYHIYLGDGVFL